MPFMTTFRLQDNTFIACVGILHSLKHPFRVFYVMNKEISLALYLGKYGIQSTSHSKVK
jgi:hypothetical protein